LSSSRPAVWIALMTPLNQPNASNMTKDPICGMTVDEATALRAERDGETFFGGRCPP
jgi:hypothetical protein